MITFSEAILPRPEDKRLGTFTPMKHNKKKDLTSSAASQQPEPVCFEFTHPTARSVCIAGTFNDWQPQAKPMHRIEAGHWMESTALAAGTYEYCFVVDGQWMPDPLASQTVPNPFGGMNSILKVHSSPQVAHRADGMTLPLKNANNPPTQKS
ncbi:MAG TPA: glycogen-binding domain-containing protein [Verrucomicrobiae bacterium]|nr:glycogen-binding domain-containing protein [Verrucomicrobiae bacterium]